MNRDTRKIELFFELLQVATGTRRELSRMPSQQEWDELFEMSVRQTLTAVSFKTVSQLLGDRNDSDDFAQYLGINEMTYYQWLGLTAAIGHKNLEMNRRCAEVCDYLSGNGFCVCILKGQSNLANYPSELRDCRAPGDIDLWCAPASAGPSDVTEASAGQAIARTGRRARRAVLDWVLADWKSRGEECPEVLYHHVDWKYGDEMVEVHYRPSWLNSLVRNARLQRWFDANGQWGLCTYTAESGESFPIPTTSFNVVYQLIHIYRHLFSEGVGLRQLLDYYFVLQAFHKDASADSKAAVMKLFGSLGLERFAAAVMYVLRRVFAMPEEYCLCEVDQKRGEFLLNEIMLAGNMGRYDSRNVINENEGFLKRFVRRQRRFSRFIAQYPLEVVWGPFYTFTQRLWRIVHGWN